MKKYLNISWCLLLVLGFSSCEIEDDEIRDEPVDIGGYAVLADNNISIFDTNETLSIDFYTAEGVTAESVEILQRPDEDSPYQVIGTATVSGETATFNSSILGDLEADSYPIRIRTTYSNGNVSEDPFSVSVDHAISLGDNPTETTLDSLSTRVLEYEVFTFGATVDDVTLSVKEGSEGTYQATSLDLPTDEGTVEMSEIDLDELGIDLEVGDTLYYRFTVTSGTMTDSAESYVAIIPKAFTNTNSATISNDPDADELDLWTGEISAEEGEIVFLDPRGFAATADTDIMFVQVDEDYWESADVLSARAAYEEGAPVSTVTPVADGEVYVYAITRDVEDEDGNVETMTFYGVIQVGDIVVVNDTVVSLDIDYMEGR